MKNSLKSLGTSIVTVEVPNEISLAISISGCPIHCPKCHSKYLWKDKGDIITEKYLVDNITANEGITCVLLMGGDKDHEEIINICNFIRIRFPNIKVAWYSGSDLDLNNFDNFDYIKVGPFKSELGPLSSKSTNQRIYRIIDKKFMDITNYFWK